MKTRLVLLLPAAILTRPSVCPHLDAIARLGRRRCERCFAVFCARVAPSCWLLALVAGVTRK